MQVSEDRVVCPVLGVQNLIQQLLRVESSFDRSHLLVTEQSRLRPLGILMARDQGLNITVGEVETDLLALLVVQ